MFITSGAEPTLLNSSGRNTIPLGDGSAEISSEKSREWQGIGVLGPMLGATGGLLGAVGVPGSPLLGAGIGATLGLAIAIDCSRRFRGSVEVEHNGKKETRKWYGTPETHLKTPQEIRTKLHALGALGDDVVPVHETELGPISEELKTYQKELRNLASERRLLADLGGKTRYGKSALQLVGAGTAAKRLSSGQSVHIVDVHEVKDIPRSLKTEATSTTLSQKAVRNQQYVERSLRFKLTEISQALELAGVKQGTGLPKSLAGLPKHESSFTQNVYTRTEIGNRKKSSEKGDETKTSFAEMKKDRSVEQRPAPVAQALQNLFDPSTRSFMMAGGAAGVLAGFAIPGIDPAAAATVGAVGGHFIGRVSRGREAAGVGGSDLAKNLSTGTCALAGAGIGALAALQTGQPGMISAIGVGAIGGAVAGALLKKGSADSRMLATQAGFCAGAALGVGAHFLLPGLAGAIALAPLGAVAGGTFARLAAR